MEHLTIQAFLQREWVDIAQIAFPRSDENNWRITELHYQSDYAIEYLECDDNHAVSLAHPVSLFFEDKGSPGWLRFLDDIVPSGASRRYWVNRLDINELTTSQQNFILLKYGTISPVGNLRIKESLPEFNPLAETLWFTLDDVINRAADFLDYAQQRGAAAGGATGAGGEAPKLLLRYRNDRQIWIDTWQDNISNTDKHYLVKYPRGARTEVDCNILRAEYHYYHELTEMGFTTIPINGMRLEEGRNYPSLWLPRFDTFYTEDGNVGRYAMESVYSMLQKGPGAELDHEETLRSIIQKISHSHMVSEGNFHFDVSDFVIEWVRRDLLNIIFGNSDNHGRNTAFMRYQGEIKLAPIYDFAPMKADPEGIPRSTKWSPALETGGEYRFPAIAEALADLVEPGILLAALQQTARQLYGLENRLRQRGVPEQIMSMPSIGFKFIADKLHRWGLL